MTENEISYIIRGAVFEIYNAVGPGLLESAYETALLYELSNKGLDVRTQVGLPFSYKEIKGNTIPQSTFLLCIASFKNSKN